MLQEFNITIMDRPGKENEVVDFLSRLQTKGEDVLVYDDFPNEHYLVYLFMFLGL